MIYNDNPVDNSAVTFPNWKKKITTITATYNNPTKYTPNRNVWVVKSNGSNFSVLVDGVSVGGVNNSTISILVPVMKGQTITVTSHANTQSVDVYAML